MAGAYTLQQLQTPGIDAINPGAGPVGEALLGLAAGGGGYLANALTRGGTSAAEAMTPLMQAMMPNAATRAAQMGVSPTTDAMRVPFLNNTDQQALINGLTSPWVRRILGGITGSSVFDMPMPSPKSN